MPHAFAYAAKYYSGYLLRKNRFTDVIYFGRKGIAGAIQSKDKISVIDIASLLENAYEATKRQDSTFYFSKMVNNYRDFEQIREPARQLSKCQIQKENFSANDITFLFTISNCMFSYFQKNIGSALAYMVRQQT